MAFLRASALRSAFRGTRPTVARPQLFRQIARRGYASGGHEHTKSGGDALWAAGAVAMTVPTCWYLLQDSPDTSHGHGDHHDSHVESHGEEKEEVGEDKAEKSDEGEEKAEDSEKSEESNSDDEKGADTPDTSDDEGGNDESTEPNEKNTKKTIPDAKGGSKKRLESNKAIKLGEDAGYESGEKPASSKPAGGMNSQSGKQEGLSNTDTKHSTDIANDPTKSKTADGIPETGKAKGTVDPKQPLV